MERKSEEKGRGSEEAEQYGSPGREDGSRESISSIEAIHEIAKRNARAPLDSEKQLELYLRSWWSKTYSRPLKDPLLQEYTFEELLYEFYDRVERKRVENESADKSGDRIEEEKLQENLDWAEEEERRELEALKAKNQAKEGEKQEDKQDPAEDPENAKWMEEQIKKEIDQGKQLFGDDFGEEIDFGES